MQLYIYEYNNEDHENEESNVQMQQERNYLNIHM